MSDNCLDTDSLTSVGEALAWRVPARLDHLAACASCRRELLALADLRAELLDVPGVDGLVVAPAPAAAPRTRVRPAGADGLVVAPAPEAAPRTRAGPTPRLGPGSRPPTRFAGVLAAGATFVVAAATLALVMGFLGA